ncbi:MAG: CPBP family intramembrane metalloprotease [Steroidobacteraceae bacterium]|nr:CPBP family intramembrane metalloprotease [Steroidobacteraceae bacterium]
MNPLHERIRRLTPGVEFLIVITWAFGLTIFTSIVSMGLDPARVAYTNHSLVGGMVQTIAIGVVLGWFLKVRGWTLAKIGLGVTMGGTSWGLLLFVLCLALLFAIRAVAQFSFGLEFDEIVERFPATGKLNMQVVFMSSVVSATFEELFVAGYVITALSTTRGPWTAINVSTGLRVLYHLYQGPLAVLTIVPLGLLFGWLYVRTRQLWPLILAHVLLDVAGLALITGSDPLF